MKNKIKAYIIADPINKVFLARISHYGYCKGNKQVFMTHFTESLNEADLLTKKEAKQKMEDFSKFEYVNDGAVKVDAMALEIKEVYLTYETEL
jgi:hypothetical protein